MAKDKTGKTCHSFPLVRRRPEQAAALVEDAAAARGVTGLGRLEHEFLSVLASHVPDAFARDGDGLAQALRAAGIDSAVADHVKRLRDRLRAARYGPRGLERSENRCAESSPGPVGRGEMRRVRRDSVGA